MHPCFLASRRVWAGLAVSAFLFLIVGCTPDGYDPVLKYPIRTDWLVAPGSWEIQPAMFNSPGRLPLDQLRETLKLPEKVVSADQLTLRSWVDKKLFDPNKLTADLRSEYAKQLEAMFGTPAE